MHVDADLKAGAKIQRSLLPREGQKLQDVAIKWPFKPAETVGGDIFNVIPINDDALAFYILDEYPPHWWAHLLARLYCPTAD